MAVLPAGNNLNVPGGEFNYQLYTANNQQPGNNVAQVHLPQLHLPTDPMANIDSIFNAVNTYGPRLASQQNQALQQYAPQHADMAYNLTSQYLPRYNDLFMNLRSADRRADFADMQALAPQVQEIRRAGEDPRVTALRDMLVTQYGDELGMGSSLTSEQLRNSQQYSRASQFARGLGAGQGSANAEAVAASLEGQRLQDQRQSKVQSYLAQEAATSPDPFSAILNRPASALMSAAGQMGSGLSGFASTVPNPVGLAGAVTGAGLQAFNQASQNLIAMAANERNNAMASIAGANPDLAFPFHVTG